MGYLFIFTMTISSLYFAPGILWQIYFGVLGLEILLQYNRLQRQVRGKEKDVI